MPYSRIPEISAFGMGTTGFWRGSNSGLEACIREAVSRYGLSVIDTAEMYGNGRCETALGRVLRTLPRERVYLVDKIHPDSAVPGAFRKSLEGSLKRLGVETVDLYLLHWREKVDLEFLVSSMESAVQEGKIRNWGVSNFDVGDLEDLLRVEKGENCFCNQIFYNVYERGSEFALLPFMASRGILPMSYSSLGSDYFPHPDIRRNRAVMRLCQESGIAPEAFMLNMNAKKGFCALFSTSSLEHLRSDLQTVPEEAMNRFLEIADREFPPPDHFYPLVKI